MTEIAQVSIGISATDKTKKGTDSAYKRASEAAKKCGGASQRYSRDVDRSFGAASKGMLRTLGSVEQATSRMFGGRSATSGLTSRLGKLSQVSSALGSGFGEAAAAGGAMEGVLGAVGVAAGAAIGFTVGAALAALKLADSWGRSAAQIGNAAKIMGVGTATMQEFAAASERLGIDKGVATGALGGLSQSLNDARYGNNPTAQAALAKMNVKTVLNPDGTVNVDAMLFPIANAIRKQTSAGQRKAASVLGIPQAALPAFMQGGAALKTDMVDAGKNAPMITDDDVSLGRKLTHRHTAATQKLERETISKLSRYAAQGADAAETWGIGAANKLMGGADLFADSVKGEFRPSAQANLRAAQSMERSANRIASGGRGSMIATTAGTVDAIRRAAAATGVDPNMLIGIAAHESGLRPSARAGTSSATGLFQFLNNTWLGMIKQHGAEHGLGWAANAISGGRRGQWNVSSPAARARILALRTDPYLNALMGGEMAKDNARVLAPVLGHTPTTGENYMGNFLGPSEAKRFFRLERANPNGGAADAFPDAARANRSVFYSKGGRERSFGEVAELMANFVEKPVNIEIKVSGAAPGTRVTAKTNRGTISSARLTHPSEH